MILYTQGAIYVIPIGTTVRYKFSKELYKKQYTLLSLRPDGMFVARVKGEEKRKVKIFKWNIVDQLTEFIDTRRSIGVYSILLSSYDDMNYIYTSEDLKCPILILQGFTPFYISNADLKTQK